MYELRRVKGVLIIVREVLEKKPVCRRIDESDRMGAVLPDDIVKQHEWTEEVVKAAAEKVGNGKEPSKSSPETPPGRTRDRKHLRECRWS